MKKNYLLLLLSIFSFQGFSQDTTTSVEDLIIEDSIIEDSIIEDPIIETPVPLMF